MRMFLVVRRGGPLDRVSLHPARQWCGEWGDLGVHPAWAPRWVSSYLFSAVSFYPRLNVYPLSFPSVCNDTGAVKTGLGSFIHALTVFLAWNKTKSQFLSFCACTYKHTHTHTVSAVSTRRSKGGEGGRFPSCGWFGEGGLISRHWKKQERATLTSAGRVWTVRGGRERKWGTPK